MIARVKRLLIPVSLSLFCVTAAFTVAFFLKELAFFGNLIDQISDNFIQLRANTDQSLKGGRYVFVDFDRETMRRAAWPALIGHEQITPIIRTITANSPRLVIVDIDLSWNWQQDSSKELLSALAALASKQTPVLLVREPVFVDPKTNLATFRETSLDQFVATHGTTHWFAAPIGGGDGVIRRMPPWTRGCVGDHSVVLPAPSLAVLALARNNWNARLSYLSLDRALMPVRAHCPNGGYGGAKNILLSTSQGKVELNPEVVDGIQYSLDWPPRDLAGSFQSRSLPTPVVSVLSAWPFANGEAGPRQPIFRDAIVVVGSSSPDRRDSHFTPLGEMPGAFVIINAVRAWLRTGPPNPPNYWRSLVLLAILTTGMSTASQIFFLLLPATLSPIVKEMIRFGMVGMISVGVWFVFVAWGASELANVIVVIEFAWWIAMLIAEHFTPARHSARANSENTECPAGTC